MADPSALFISHLSLSLSLCFVVPVAGPDAFLFLFLSFDRLQVTSPPKLLTMLANTFVAMFSLLLTGQALSRPILANPPATRALETLETVHIYVKRQIPAEVPVKSLNGQVERYGKRQIPAELPAKSISGKIEPYDKRQIPAEIPTRSINGEIEPYDRRQIPAEVPTKSINGKIEPYDKRQIPAEVPTKSTDGKIERYGKRQIPAEVPTKSISGKIERY
ncbi:hypothetical protein H2248_000925 [Termitomyces sp. 'cryptogamus']|nr:hypothetical protein H2248_000925 [Termitomyces sp. 'cryptogamus']